MSAQEREIVVDTPFKPGHTIQPTPEVRREAITKRKRYKDAMMSVIGTERFTALVERMYEDALSGSGPTGREARKLIFNHILGRPAQAVHHSGDVNVFNTIMDALSNAKPVEVDSYPADSSDDSIEQVSE